LKGLVSRLETVFRAAGNQGLSEVFEGSLMGQSGARTIPGCSFDAHFALHSSPLLRASLSPQAAP
jgi:hypothetical protein